jgi:uncharacterized membrane protein
MFIYVPNLIKSNINVGYFANVLMMAAPASVTRSKDRSVAGQVMVILTVLGLTIGSFLGILCASILQ